MLDPAAFGIKTPEQIQAEVKAGKYTKAQLKYAQPEAFVNGLIAEGGMIPIMLSTGCHIGNEFDQQALDAKLGYWEKAKAAYLKMLDDKMLDVDMLDWRNEVPGLTWRQAKAVHCARLFENQYMKHVNDSPFQNMFAPLDPNHKLLTDCDTKSYFLTGLMLEATDHAGNKVFSPADFSIEHLQNDRINVGHARIKMKDQMIFEASVGDDRGKNSTVYKKGDKQYEETDRFAGDVKETYSLVASIGEQYYSERLNKKTDWQKVLNFTRASLLIDPKESTLKENFAAFLYNGTNAKVSQLIAVLHSPQGFDLKSAENKQLFDDVYHMTKACLGYAAHPEEYPQTGQESHKTWLQQVLSKLQPISPVEYAKLEAHEALQSKGSSGNYIAPRPRPVDHRQIGH